MRAVVAAGLLSCVLGAAPLALAATGTDAAEEGEGFSLATTVEVEPADCPLYDTVADDAVAATVNGEELPVSTLTSYIESARSRVGSSTDAAWEAFLADQGYTVGEYWSYLVEYYGREMVLVQRAEELQIEVGSDEVDARIDQIKAALGYDTEDTEFLWDAYLALYGFTEETLRANQAYYLQRDKLYELEVERPEIGGELVQRYADAYADQYGLEVDDEGSVDLSALDDDVRAEIEADAADLAWAWACSTYADELWETADVVVLVDHQYDVEGQSHGA